METIFIILFFVLCIFCSTLPFIFLIIKCKRANARIKAAENNYPTTEEFLEKRRQEAQQENVKRAKKAFALIEQIKDPITRKVLREDFKENKVGEEDWRMHGDNAVSFVKSIIEDEKKEIKKREEEEKRKEKELSLKHAKAAGEDVCDKCKTIKPTRDKNGRCLKCASLSGAYVCYACRVIGYQYCDCDDDDGVS